MSERKQYYIGEPIYPGSNDSAVTIRAKHDYNSMTAEQFMRKYSCAKDLYRRRVNRYGDPYMNSPLARIGKFLAKIIG